MIALGTRRADVAPRAPLPARLIAWSAGPVALDSFYVAHGLLSAVHYQALVVESGDGPGDGEPVISSVGVVPVREGAVALVSI